MDVLIASEDPRARAWVRAALGPSWQVSEAHDGREARRIVERDRPALVVCDETMEPYGAFGFARDVKTMEDPPAVIVLLERALDEWLAKWSGADRWLVRPVDPLVLAAGARELAEAHGVPGPGGEEISAQATTGGTK